MTTMTLKDVLKKYEDHPEFLGVVLNDPNQRGAVDDTPLHIACRKGNVDDVEALIQFGADKNLAGDLGNTPLHQAALTGQDVVAKKLLQLGADPSIKNEFAQTALDVARLGGHTKVVELLQKN